MVLTASSESFGSPPSVLDQRHCLLLIVLLSDRELAPLWRLLLTASSIAAGIDIARLLADVATRSLQVGGCFLPSNAIEQLQRRLFSSRQCLLRCGAPLLVQALQLPGGIPQHGHTDGHGTTLSALNGPVTMLARVAELQPAVLPRLAAQGVLVRALCTAGATLAQMAGEVPQVGCGAGRQMARRHWSVLAWHGCPAEAFSSELSVPVQAGMLYQALCDLLRKLVLHLQAEPTQQADVQQCVEGLSSDDGQCHRRALQLCTSLIEQRQEVDAASSSSLPRRQPLSPEEKQLSERRALALALLKCGNPRCSRLAGASEAAAPRGRLCTGCRTVRYCSEACSRMEWPQHRAACRLLRAPPPDE